MRVKKDFIPYDRFKLVILLSFVVILGIMLYARSNEKENDLMESAYFPSDETGQQSFEPNAENQLPAIPSSHQELSINSDKTELVDDSGKLIYELGEDGHQWTPIIYPEVMNTISPEYSLLQDESDIWQIISTSGEVLFIFDSNKLVWELAESTGSMMQSSTDCADLVFDCSSANPARIKSIDEMVRVINAEIPLRSTPDAVSENFIISLAQGDLLQVTDEPVCMPYLSGANLWWPVRTDDGIEGYAAEGSAISDLYYLQPVE